MSPYKLLLASIIPDLKGYSFIHYFFLILFAFSSVIFSILDFNALLRPEDNRSLIKWINDEHNGIELWRRVLMTFSGLASFTGVLSVVLTTKGKLSLYFWGIINCVLYGTFAASYGYWGDAQMNLLFFLPLQFVGIHQWVKNMNDKGNHCENSIKSKSASIGQLFLGVMATALLTVAFYYEIPVISTALTGTYFYDDMNVPHILDALSNAMNLVAQVFLVLQFWQQWILWIAVDIMQIAMFSGVAGFIDFNIIVMWCLFLVNALCGLFIWFRPYRKSLHDEDGDADIECAMNPTVMSTERKMEKEGEMEIEGIPVGNQMGHAVAEGHAAAERYKRGLVIGKFYPLHKGHQYLIDTAASACDTLFIIICRKSTETPNAFARSKWITRLYPNASVVVTEYTDEYDDDDSELWASLTKKWLDFTPDVVFTSESYGYPYSTFLGCKHVCVDRYRETYPVSGTMVRGNPPKYWSFLSSPVKEYYAFRIVVVGAESTGKTTLCERLAEYFDTDWVPEYGRSFCETAYNKDPNYVWSSEDFLHIGTVQSQYEDKAAGTCNRVLICDTDAFATCIWHERYVGGKCNKLEELVAKRLRPDLYIISDVESAPFVQDGYRDGEHIRQWMQQQFIDKLEATGRPYVVLSGSYEERFKAATEIVTKILQSFDV